MEMYLEDFTHDPEFPFFIQYGYHDCDMFMHTHHDFSELVIITEGSAMHVVNDEEYRISKGDVFVINSGVEHGFTHVKNFRLCNIMFKPQYIVDSNYDITRTAGFQALFVLEPQQGLMQNHFTSRLKLNTHDYARVFGICDFMHGEYSEKSEGWKTMLLSGFIRLVAELSRLYRFDNLGEDDEMISLAKATAYIENNYFDDLSIPMLASLSNYSERQFIRVFKDAYGCKPTEYIRKLRIKNACRMLKIYDLSVTEVAVRCGYSDSNYFTRVFRRETGITPTQFRSSLSGLGLQR